MYFLFSFLTAVWTGNATTLYKRKAGYCVEVCLLWFGLFLLFLPLLEQDILVRHEFIIGTLDFCPQALTLADPRSNCQQWPLSERPFPQNDAELSAVDTLRTVLTGEGYSIFPWS